MKNNVLYACVCVPMILQAAAHTFREIPVPWALGRPERLTTRARTYDRDAKCRDPFFEIVPFGGQTTNSCDITNYFLPEYTSSLFVAEQNAPDAVNRDIDARHFNIETTTQTMSSTLSFCPRETFAGAGFLWFQPIWQNKNVRFWGELAFPVEHVRTTMGMKEQAITAAPSDGVAGLDGAIHVATMVESFAEPEFTYAKLDANCHTTTRVAFVDLRFGVDGFTCAGDAFTAYLGVSGPTGNTPCAVYTCEPIAGYAGHWVVLTGVMGDLCWWIHDRWTFHTTLAADIHYLTAHCEKRSFDLVDKTWGRYFEMYDSRTQARTADAETNASSGVFGSNVLTRQATIKPGFWIDASIVATLAWDCIRLDLGYSLHAQEAEQVCLSYIGDAAVKDYAGIGITSNVRTIAQPFNVDPASDLPSSALVSIPVENYTAFERNDISSISAATPAQIEHTLFAALEWKYNNWRFLLGGSVLKSVSVGALERWTAWGMIAMEW